MIATCVRSRWNGLEPCLGAVLSISLFSQTITRHEFGSKAHAECMWDMELKSKWQVEMTFMTKFSQPPFARFPCGIFQLATPSIRITFKVSDVQFVERSGGVKFGRVLHTTLPASWPKHHYSIIALVNCFLSNPLHSFERLRISHRKVLKSATLTNGNTPSPIIILQ